MPIYNPGTVTYNNPVRYIRDSVNGSSANVASHWVEIQALDSAGNNKAKGKTATLISGTSEGQAISRLTDGDTTSANYFGSGGTNPTVQVDLGAVYDIANVKVWHYYADGRTYNNPVTQVSSDGSTWVTISNGVTYAETSAGKTWSCDSVASKDINVNHEIGKIYDYDGTTSYQIGKVYDYDGTTSSLIYSADYELFPENRTLFTTYTAGSGGTKTRTIGTTELVAQVSGGGDAGTLYRAGVRTTNKIDFSKYSKLIVVGSEISDTYGTWSGCDIAMSSSTSISGSSSGQSGANVTQSWAWKADISKHNNTWNTFNKEFDISGVTGSYYLWFYAYSYHVRGAGIKCTSIILVE